MSAGQCGDRRESHRVLKRRQRCAELLLLCLNYSTAPLLYTTTPDHCALTFSRNLATLHSWVVCFKLAEAQLSKPSYWK
jgi:hypothetical protein